MNASTDRERQTQPSERYDVAISGGGLIGLAAGVSLAESGHKVVIVERRGTLGWEIGRARRVHLQLDEAKDHSPLAARLKEELTHHSAFAGRTIQAPIAELIFDRWAEQAGVDVLFHGWPVRGDTQGDQVSGITVGAKEGYLHLAASWVVETDDAGRLVAHDLREDCPPTGVTRTVIVNGSEVSQEMRTDLGPDLGEVLIRPLEKDLAQIDVELARSAYSEREARFSEKLKSLLGRLKTQVPELRDCRLLYIADDEWYQPSFVIKEAALKDDPTPIGHWLTRQNDKVVPVNLRAGELQAAVWPGLILAGPWLPGYRRASTDDTTHVLNRMLMGEAVARYIAAVSDQSAAE